MSQRARFVLWLAVIILVTFSYDLVTMPHPHWRRVAWVPFATGIVRPGDMLLNVLLYVPFGVFFPRRNWSAVALGIPCAFALSSLLELSQVWSHERFPSATDVAMNVSGAAVGLWLASRRRAGGDSARLSEAATR